MYKGKKGASLGQLYLKKAAYRIQTPECNGCSPALQNIRWIEYLNSRWVYLGKKYGRERS